MAVTVGTVDSLWMPRVARIVAASGDVSRLFPDPRTAPRPPLAGKMLRARLSLMVCGELGALGEEAVNMAAGIEMVHNASLLHDDVVDGADCRRGEPSLFRTHGNRAAIMTGDVFFARAMVLFCRSPRIRIHCAVSRAVDDLASGQLAEDAQGCPESCTRESYYSVVDLKTGSLMALCLEIPGILAELPDADIEALRRAGIALGRAFQIADDLLDLYGDSSRTGKDVLRDLRGGRVTFPHLLMLETANADVAGLLRHALTGGAVAPAAVLEAVKTNGVHARAREILDGFLCDARERLASVLHADGAERLCGLLRALAFRDC